MHALNLTERCTKSILQAKKLKNLNIFITDTFDAALRQSKSHDPLSLKSKLDGKLFTIKDNFCTKNVKTTCGSKMLESYYPTYNATVYDRLIKSGAICLGKTNLDEFGMGSLSASYFGIVKNPWNLSHDNKRILELEKENNDFYVSGGSSGGAAASVAADLVDL